MKLATPLFAMMALLAPITALGASVKNHYPQGWPFLSHCVSPQGEGGLFDYNLPTCLPEADKPPITRGSKIAIVGGGPGGVSMAKLLHDRGFKDLTLFEKSDRLGGKSKRWVDPDGNAHDVGTCYVVGKYECIEHFFDQMNMTEMEIDKSRFTSSDKTVLMNMSPPSFGTSGVWCADYAYQNYGVDPATYADRIREDAKAYIGHWTASMGSMEYMFPDEATMDFDSLNMSFLGWLEARKLYALIPRLHISTAAQGYGGLGDIPAFYGLMWNHPNMFGGDGKHSMVLEGFQALWERLAASTDADVRLNTAVTKIFRFSEKVSIHYENEESGKGKEAFDFLVFAAPMPSGLELFKSVSDEEFELFHSYRVHELVASIGVLEQGASSPIPPDFELFSWADRMDMQSDYFTDTLTRNRKKVKHKAVAGLIDGVDGPLTIRHTANINGFENDMAGILSISSTRTSDEKLTELIDDSLSSYGLDFALQHRTRWPTYMPWKSLADVVEERMPWRMWDLQGQQRTWFVGSYVSFESVADVLDYNIKLVNTLCQPACESLKKRGKCKRDPGCQWNRKACRSKEQ